MWQLPYGSLLHHMMGATFQFDLDRAVTLANFAVTGGTKAHSLIETASAIIPLNYFQPHYLCSL